MNLERLPIPIYERPPTMRDISIDIETLGTRYDAPVLAIGAQLFDRDTGKMGQTFYYAVRLDSALDHGKVSADTLRWWMQQSDAARQVFTDRPDKLYLTEVLKLFGDFVRGIAGARVWGNGATFDITILEHAYEQVKLETAPWHFRNIRDMRTIIDAADCEAELNAIDFVGTRHHALNDATWQAKAISHAWQKIRGAIHLNEKATAVAQTEAVAPDDDDL